MGDYVGMCPSSLAHRMQNTIINDLIILPTYLRIGYIFSNNRHFNDFDTKQYILSEKSNTSEEKEAATVFALKTVKPLMTEKEKMEYSYETLCQFVDSLKINVVFDSGFHNRANDTLDVKTCFCPLSTIFSRLHTIFKLEQYFGVKGSCKCNECKKMTPQQLIKHLVQKQQQSVFHRLAYVYLKRRYHKYWHQNIGHERFYYGHKQMLNLTRDYEHARYYEHSEHILKSINPDNTIVLSLQEQVNTLEIVEFIDTEFHQDPLYDINFDLHPK